VLIAPPKTERGRFALQGKPTSADSITLVKQNPMSIIPNLDALAAGDIVRAGNTKTDGGWDAVPSFREIRWTPEPMPAADVLSMSDEDVMLAALVESDAYRNLSLSGVNALHHLHQDHRRVLLAHERLLAEFRHLRTSKAVAA